MYNIFSGEIPGWSSLCVIKEEELTDIFRVHFPPTATRNIQLVYSMQNETFFQQMYVYLFL